MHHPHSPARRAYAWAFAIPAAMALAAPLAHAGVSVHNAGCGLHSDYGLDIEPDRLLLTRTSGTPARVVIADGTLSVDDRPVEVGSADRQRLRDIERGIRDAWPDAKSIAHEAVSIAFEAVGEATAAFARDGDEARASARRLTEAAGELNRQIDASRRFADWQGEDVERFASQAAGTLAGEIVGTIGARAISVALSGDERAAADLEARASGIDKNVERVMERRGKALEQRVQALCTRMRGLVREQAALEVRPGGRPLDLARITD